MARDIRNVAASVRKQLLSRAHDKSRPFNERMQHYAMERFLYRLAQSAYVGVSLSERTIARWRC